MANHKSAQKRARQTRVRTARNTDVKSRTRTVVRRFRTEAASGKASTDDLKAAESALRRAASKGVIPKRRASRLVSRMAKQLAKQG